eukprot:763832-Hanusia_phi.AAC.1
MFQNGTSFAQLLSTSNGRIALSSCESTEWLSDTILRCYSNGFSSTHSFAFSSGSVVVSRTELVSFDVLTLNFSNPQNMYVGETMAVSIFGHRFGLSDNTITSKIGYSSTEFTTWISDTAVLVTKGQLSTFHTAVVVTGGTKVSTKFDTFTFDSASLSTSRMQNLAQTGSRSITILGYGFLSQLVTAAARVSFTSSQATEWLSETSTRCKATISLRHSAGAIVTIQSKISTVTELLSIDNFFISSIYSNAVLNSKGKIVVATVTDFNQCSHSAILKVGSSSLESTLWISITSITGFLHSAVQRSSSVMLTAVEVSTATSLMSYDPVSLSSFRSQNIVISSGSSLQISGTSRIDYDHTLQAVLHGTACEATKWLSSSAIICLCAKGTGNSLKIALTSSGSMATISNSASYDAIHVSSVQETNSILNVNVFKAWNNYTNTLFLSIQSSIGHTASESTVWSSESVIYSKVSNSFSRSLAISVTHSLHLGSVSSIYSYDVLALLGVNSTNVFVPGFILVATNVTLPSYGISSRASVGISATEYTQWSSTDGLSCKVAHGLQKSVHFTLSQGIAMGTITSLVTFDFIGISSTFSFNLRTGSTSSALVLDSLGVEEFSPALRIGFTSCESTFWPNEASIKCFHFEYPQRSLQVALTAVDCVSTVTESVTMDMNSVTTLQPSNVAFNSTTMLFISSHSDWLHPSTVKAQLGQSVSPSTDWFSVSSLTVKTVQGFLCSRSISITSDVGGIQSLTEAISYNAQLTGMTISRQNLLDRTDSFISLSHGVGIASFSESSRIGGTASELTSWISFTSLHTIAAQGTSATLGLIFTLAAMTSSTSELFSFDLTSHSMVQSANLLAYYKVSGLTLLRSSHASLPHFTLNARLGLTNAQSTIWESISSILCTSSHATTSKPSLSVLVTLGPFLATNTELLSYDSVVLFTDPFSNQVLRGIQAVANVSFFPSDVSLSAVNSLTACEATIWNSESNMACKISSGSGGSGRIILTAGVVTSTLTEFSTYDTYIVSSVSVGNIIPNTPFELIGGNQLSMSIVGLTTSSAIASTAAEVTFWTSETTVWSVPSSGYSRSMPLSITVAGSVCSLSESVSYDIVSDLSSTMSNVGGHNIFVFTIISNIDAYTASMSIGFTSAESTDWSISSSIKSLVDCRSSQHTQVFVLTAFAAVTSTTEAVSYDNLVVSAASSANFGSSSNTSILFTLGSFGVVTPVLRIGNTGSCASEWLSETSIYALADSKLEKSHSVMITQSLLVETLTESASFDLVALTSGYPQNSQEYVVRLLTSTTPIHSASSSLGNTACESSCWLSTSSITVKVARGTGSSANARVSICDSTQSQSKVFSYDSYEGTLASGNTLSAQLNFTIFLSQLNYSYFIEGTPAVQAGLTACEQTEWNSVDSILCKTSFGAGSSSQIMLTCSNAVSTLTEGLTYQSPLVSSVSSANGAVNSSSVIFATTLFGEFSATQFTSSSAISDTSCEATSWISDSALTCSGNSFFEHSLRMTLTIAQLVGTLTEVVTYSVNSLSSLGYTNSPSGTVLWMAVSNEPFLTSSARIQGSTCEQSLWISLFSLLCMPSEGLGRTYGVTLTTGVRSCSTSELFTFDQPSYSNSVASNLPLYEHSSSVLIDQASSLLRTTKLRLGFSDCESTVWLNMFSLECKHAFGIGKTLHLVVTQESIISTFSKLGSYDGPSASSLQLSNFPTSGEILTTISGINFATLGTTVSSGAGLTSSETTDWTSDTAIEVKPAKGIRNGRETVVSIVQSSSTITDSLSYDVPTMERFYPQNGPILGLQHVTIIGTGFGSADYTVTARIGDSSCSTVLYSSETSLICFSPRGIGAGHALDVEVGQQYSKINRKCSTCYQGINDGLPCFTDDDCNLNGNGSCLAIGSPCTVTGPGRVCSDNSNTSCISDADCYDGTCSSCVDSYCWPTFTFCYDAPKTEFVTPDAGPTTGGVNLTIVGANFDIIPRPADSHFGYSASESTIYVSDTSALALLAPGVGKNLEVQLTILGYDQPLANFFSYYAPQASSVFAVNYGSWTYQMSVFGSNFATADYTMEGRVGDTSSESTTWESDSSVVCIGTIDNARSLPIRVSVALQFEGTKTSSVSFDGLSITESHLQNFPSTGHNWIQITGALTTRFDSSQSARLGFSAFESTEWISITSLQSRSGSGASRSLQALITQGSLVSSFSEAFTFDAGEISSSVGNAPIVNNVVIEISGSNLGPNSVSPKAHLQIADSKDECLPTEWSSQTSIYCRVPGGDVLFAQGSRSIVITAQQEVYTLSNVFSYDLLSFLVGNVRNLATTGSVSLEITGLNFGLYDYTLKTEVGLTVSEASFWFSDTSLQCKSPSGWGEGLDIAITLLHSFSCCQTLTSFLTYDSQSMSSVAASNAPKFDPYEDLLFTTSGSNFMLADLSVAARVGETSCEVTTWMSESALLGKFSAGVHSSRTLVMTSHGIQASHTESMTFDAPSVSCIIFGTECVLCGQLTLAGLSFGSVDSTPIAKLSGMQLDRTDWMSTTQVSGRLDLNSSRYVGAGGSATVLTVSSLVGSTSSVLQYKSVPISTVSPQNAPTTGATIITVTGGLFGRGFAFFIGIDIGISDFSMATRIGGTAQEATTWLSDSSLISRLPHGLTSGLDLTVSLATSKSTLAYVLSYDKPTASAVTVSNIPSTSSILLSIMGAGYGTGDYTVSAAFQTCSEATMWQSDIALWARSPSGSSLEHRIIISASLDRSENVSNVGTLTECFTFDIQSIYAVTAPNGGSSGGYAVSMPGSNFGSQDQTPETRIGGTGCEATKWLSSSAVLCYAPPGTSFDQSVILTHTIRISTLSLSFSYDDLILLDVFPKNFPTTGSILAQIIGANLKVYDTSPMAVIGYTVCELSAWISDSIVVCKAGDGIGHDLYPSVTIAQSIYTVMKSLSFDDPSVLVAQPRNVYHLTSASVTVIGTNFATAAYSASSSIGSSPAESTKWLSGTTMMIKTVAGTGNSKNVLLTSDVSPSTTSKILSFDSAIINSLAQNCDANCTLDCACRIPSTNLGYFQSPVTLFVDGQNFAKRDESMQLRFLATSAEVTSWSSDTEISNTLSSGWLAGQSHGKVVVSQSGVSQGTLSDAFTFDAVQVSSISQLTGCSSCNLLTIYGSNVGVLDTSVSARLGGLPCEVTEWGSESSLTCKIAGNENGISYRSSTGVVVTMSNREGSLSRTYTYVEPVVTGLNVSNFPTTGGIPTLVYGELFGSGLSFLVGLDVGLVDWTARARLGSTSCEWTDWISETAL